MTDQTIAHYRVQAKIGSGGMGEVYRARDTRLERDVALKVLPETVARDAQRMARFEREAKVLASLNHPNIASIYGIEESNGTRALVMELVEGNDLAVRIRKGHMPVEEALPVAKQIAEALEYAHDRGIIHRDLKPANIKLTPDGHVKLLDFGLAKALEGETAEEELQNSPTLSAAATRAGMLLGTAAYMSPEQARGKHVDRRADIWAFGCVLFEMLTGASPFSGETTSDTLASVIRAEPDWSLVPETVPARIRELLRRCLQKDPKQRLQAIGEARIAIEAAIAGTPQNAAAIAGAAAEPAAKRRRMLPWAVAATAAVIALAALYWRPSESEPRQVMQFSLPLTPSLGGILEPNPGSPFAFSADGSQIVFVGSIPGKPSQLFLLALNQRTPIPLAGTEDASQPFFSPDGQWVGFFAMGKMRKVSVHGGPATQLCDAPVPHGAIWYSDDTIIYAPNFGSGLLRISSGGGDPQALTSPNGKEQEVSHRWPQVLPGGQAILFTIQVNTQTSYDDARIAVLSLRTGKWHTVLDGGSYARYVPSGHMIYAHAGTLMGVPFDVGTLQATGKPVPVLEGVATTAATSGGAEYDVASTGLLAYVPGTTRGPERSLMWFDRQGIGKKLSMSVNNYSAPRISPDGKLVAVQMSSSAASDVWVYEFARNTLTRLTFGPGNNEVPVWTNDGRRVIYRYIRGTPSFRWKLADGSGAEETLLTLGLDAPGAVPFSVSADGKTLLFGRRDPTGVMGTYTLSLDGSGKAQPFLQSAFNRTTAHFSPDGHWVAYTSNESGRDEVYVQPFPGPGGKWMVSSEGGSSPRWARKSGELFFMNGSRMMSVPVETQRNFKAGTPKELFESRNYVGPGNYDVAPDGQHFVMVTQEEASASANELNVILNWTEELKRRAPVAK